LSAIDDLIAQIQEPRLREQLKREWAEAQKTKKFGLVFDRHLPELVPISKARPRRGDWVARKGSADDLWRAQRVSGGTFHCVRPEGIAGGGLWKFSLSELFVVDRFGEPSFPALTPVDHIQIGPADAPWHNLIEATKLPRHSTPGLSLRREGTAALSAARRRIGKAIAAPDN
jgi:adenine-specific DNA-methyltransferase